MIDDYCYHKKNENGEEVSTNVLRNKYDLRYDFLLEEVERRLTSLRLLEIYTDKPIKGNFDFKRLFNTLENAGYKGDYVIEIYSKGLDVRTELEQSKRFFDNLL